MSPKFHNLKFIHQNYSAPSVGDYIKLNPIVTSVSRHRRIVQLKLYDSKQTRSRRKLLLILGVNCFATRNLIIYFTNVEMKRYVGYGQWMFEFSFVTDDWYTIKTNLYRDEWMNVFSVFILRKTLMFLFLKPMNRNTWNNMRDLTGKSGA